MSLVTFSDSKRFNFVCEPKKNIMSAKIKKKDALLYHEFPTPGKIQVNPTKKHSTQRELSLAYSPGVAEPCLEIADNELDVYRYTSKGNLVAVISNGTAVLGLGDIGPSASKPVMEGKALLFKIFADIDVFDIEIDAAENPLPPGFRDQHPRKGTAAELLQKCLPTAVHRHLLHA